MGTNLKYSQEQIQNKAAYNGLYYWHACLHNLTGHELRVKVTDDFRKMYGRLN